MQGVSIWGLVLALAQLLDCSATLAMGGEEAPDLVMSLSVQKGLKALFDISLEEAQKRTLEDSIAHVVNSSLIYEKRPSKKKASGFNDKKAWPVPSLNKTRTKRQSGSHIPIITLDPVVRGPDEPKTDHCEREEVLHEDGDCYEILSQGPCEDTEYVLIDINTKKGFCAPRLCSPDRVFVFEDQKCHDPFENDICPPGRQLFTSCYGTPVCICPDGTYEEEDDPDEDVCKPILSEIDSCSFGEVFWFTSFRSEPRCIPDPCLGLNSKRNKNELPYIPSSFDGKCYQVGKEIPQCPSDTFYTISFSGLKGICASLEDAGYLVADDDVLQSFASRYGPPLQKGRGSLSFASGHRRSSNLQDTSRFKHRLQKSEPKDEVEEPENDFELDNRLQESTFSSHGISKGLLNFLLKTARQSSFQKPARRARARTTQKTRKSFRREEEEEEEEEQEIEEEEEHHRSKRDDSLPYASPSNVFEPSLASCRAGAIRGLNNRCRTSVLPSRRPLSRPKRRAPPTRPDPSCPLGHFYTIGNRCADNNGQIQSILLSQGLG